MWAQAMVEHGLLSGAVAGIEAAQYYVTSALADTTTRWVLIVGGVVLAGWLALHRRLLAFRALPGVAVDAQALLPGRIVEGGAHVRLHRRDGGLGMAIAAALVR